MGFGIEIFVWLRTTAEVNTGWQSSSICCSGRVGEINGWAGCAVGQELKLESRRIGNRVPRGRRLANKSRQQCECKVAND